MENHIVSESKRLDQFLADVLKTSRNQVLNLIKDGHIFVNGKVIIKPSFKLNTNEKVEIQFPEKQENILSEDVKFDIDILYEDDDVLVINKKPGIVVHPAPSVKEATIVDWLKKNNYVLSTLNGEIRPGIVHRLDKGTSGALVIAKNNYSHAKLSEQLSDKTMGRIYLAFIDIPLKENCIIERPIGRNPNNRLKKAIIFNGKYAKSAFLNLNLSQKQNLIACKLFTGRTHQIRIHLASINRHILGDDLYGIKSLNDKINTIMLHAYLLYFIHPRTGKLINVVADLPIEFKENIDNTNNQKEVYEKILPKNIVSSFDDCDEWLCFDEPSKGRFITSERK